MPYLFIFLFWLSVTGLAGTKENHPTDTIKDLQRNLTKILASNEPLEKNPLEKYNFDNFVSRSYLYFYRASAYARMAKNSKQKLPSLDLALDDLNHAKLAPHFDESRVDQLVTDVLKEKIDVLRAAKNYPEIINTIGLLPQKDRTDSRYVAYYAEALFNSSNIDDWKKLARNYLTTLNDETVLKKYLDKTPPWASLLSTINVPGNLDKKVKILPKAPLFTKEIMLSDPIKALEPLGKNTYFKSAEDVFKIASETYLSSYKKSTLTHQPQKFVNVFSKKMHHFAPAFIDSLIFSFWKISDLKSAEMLSRSFLDQFEGHPLYPKILYNLGRIQEDGKSYAQAAVTFKRFLDKSDDATYLELAKFRAGWTLYLAEQKVKSKPFFEDYIRNYPDGRYASTCEYFLIKIEKDPSPKESIERFIKKYPLNLYSFLLVDEFKLPNTLILQTFSTINSLKNNFLVQEFKADIKTLNQLDLFRELKQLDLKDDAIKVLKSISSSENNELLNLYLAAQFQDLDDTHGEVANLIKVASNENEHRELVPWKSLFPCYRRDAVEKELALQNSTVSPLLVLALVRQESTFNKSAQSTANAIGLMQLTAGTAKDAAKRLQLNNYSLFNEEDNLRLGIKTIVDLLKKYHRIDYALAAYNAGESPTNQWISLRGHLDPIAFVESIPYPETRAYIKSILRNFAIYRMLYEKNYQTLVSYQFDN